MQSEFRQRSVTGIGAGILLQILSQLLVLGGGLLSAFGWLAGVVGSILFIWGCCNLAMSKGYPWLVGLLGFFWCIGLVVLLLLPDKS